MFSGLNLAYFSVSRLRLEVEIGTGNLAAQKVLDLRSDSNFLLTTSLWGNVSTNVLLTLFSNSVMAGLGAFLLSTIIITLLGEIFPQAFFSRNALKTGAGLAPVLRLYQVVLFPVAKPVAMLLDVWLGKEGVDSMRERGVREMIRQHMEADETDLGRIESLGALNFLGLMTSVPRKRENLLINVASFKCRRGVKRFSFPKTRERKQDRSLSSFSPQVKNGLCWQMRMMSR